jgi:serine protease Do
MGGRLLTLLLTLAAAAPTFAGVTPELQRQIQASTFEVVMKKPAEGSVRYEKPLPLELLPYIERTDPYRSIGTALALGNNAYATAAHVLLAGVDSQYGPPALRAADGSIHAIGKILKLSAAEDLVEFSLVDELNAAPLPVNRSPHIDEMVLAVGNALGEGIVVRDGLFTSETPEQQDGRWKWIRFSAAASPGNSGGPLLDASGAIIGLVIAKSPNENLNYALPIANVLDAPQKARFDERVLTKLSFAQGSRTYVLKDAFPLPLPWAQFVRTYQALIQRHSDAAREALLAADELSMFPKGAGSEAILYQADTSSREPGVVIQRDDGTWVIQRPSFQFTDLPGDGRVGVAGVAQVLLVALHRGGEASDDAFYSDSKSFMDIVLKTLNLRRPVGSDQVKVTSLGRAVRDETTQDRYGRTWQLRIWPVPYLDLYVVAQLLPTPDGYVGLIEYAPSLVLRQLIAPLSLLASQVTVTYQGTLGEWQAFLTRKALLPAALKDVTLTYRSGWTLITPRFETAVPAEVMPLDIHSELLLTMGYMLDGSRVVWDIGGAWWDRDLKEKVYVGLSRQPRPPSTAPLDLRTHFDDLQARRSPYDGAPVRISSDSVDVSMAIQAAGSRAGMASSGVMYGLTLRLDGHPSAEQIANDQTQLLQATRILERDVGEDVAASQPATVQTASDAFRVRLQELSTGCDQYGKDLRGRLCSEDFNQYLTPFYQTAFSSPLGSAEVDTRWKSYTERAAALQRYWVVVPYAVHNRDVWTTFLSRNHLPADTPHDAAVLAAESSLQQLMDSGPPTSEWATHVHALATAYVFERVHFARKLGASASGHWSYQKRTSSCPAPATGTSGKATPRLAGLPPSLEDFYPISMRKLGIEGAVVLSLKVDATGCVTEAAVAGSSGSDDLDEAALRWAYTAPFLPAEKDGRPVEGTTPIAVDFSLSPPWPD